MKVSVVGTGYVGLVSGVCLADTGHSVVCVDIDEEKVAKINRAEPPIYEKGLDDLLRKTIDNGALVATTDLRQAVLTSDVSLIAVGTPFDGQLIDLTYVKTVAGQIGEVLKDKPGYHVVIVKSTVVPGTTDDVVLPILEEASGKKAGVNFGVGMNPEFLREGEAIEDFMFPDRIVLGGIDEKTHTLLRDLYAAFGSTDMVMTNNKTAEMIKYTANSLLATLISFSNEIGNLCTALGDIDAVDVMKGVHLDKRFTPILNNGERVWPKMTTYLEAGCGFGGSCFPKDVKALIAHGQRKGQSMALLQSVIDINKDQPSRVLGILHKHLPNLAGVRIAVLGLAFKPGTDDMRESPSIPIVQALQAVGAEVAAFDPIAKHEAQKILGDEHITYTDDLGETINNARAVLLLTRWPDFQVLPEVLKNLDPQPVLIDGRRMLPKDSVQEYDGIGL